MAVREILTFTIGILMCTSSALADNTADTADALSKTQDLLRDPNQREKAAKESSKAAATMKSAEDFVGKEHTSDLYDIIADVMGTITNRSQGNVKLMNEDTQKSPENFIKLLTPEQMAKIEALAKKIEAERNPSSTTTPPK